MAQSVKLTEGGKLVGDFDGLPVDLTVDDQTIDELTITKLGLGVTPVGVRSAYTQTYSTAARTVPAAVPDITGGESPTEAEYNALNADVLALKKVITALIDDLQAFGLVG